MGFLSTKSAEIWEFSGSKWTSTGSDTVSQLNRVICDGKKVVNSDESKFNLLNFDGRIRVWRQKGERYLPECINKSTKGGGGSVMFLGYIIFAYYECQILYF